MHTHRMLLAVALLAVLLLLVTASAYGLPLLQISEVPHPIEGREDCLLCHDTGKAKPFPEDHADRDNESCSQCHEIQAADLVLELPHPTEGREDCLLCHDIGKVKPFQADHEGRDNDSCLECHQTGGAEEPGPTPTPPAILPPAIEILPTPIQEPLMFGENTCISCHEGLEGKSAQITADWTESVHAARGVGCVSCHGGDPSQTDVEASMSPDAGYLGPLPKERIPGLCASCHSDLNLMRPFDIPTDQFDQYWQSQHGQVLLEGDPNGATCFDCHGGHRTLKISDPASQVYPSNEPAMCASCHADPELMGPYDIPTDQYELYQESVHGVALLEKRNLRAPTCSTCHAKHGAALPGFQEVPDICGQCHGSTEDAYLHGAHRFGVTTEEMPRCVTCHGRYDVQPATRDIFLGTDERHCGSCHAPGTKAAGQVEAIYQALTEADEAYELAEATVAEAIERRLIMAAQEEQLQMARSPLIEVQAMQHTVNLEDIEAKSEESVTISQEVQASAEAALRDVDMRRLGMIVALVFIILTVVALVLIKRGLDRDLEAERARPRS